MCIAGRIMCPHAVSASWPDPQGAYCPGQSALLGYSSSVREEVHTYILHTIIILYITYIILPKYYMGGHKRGRPSSLQEERARYNIILILLQCGCRYIGRCIYTYSCFSFTHKTETCCPTFQGAFDDTHNIRKTHRRGMGKTAYAHYNI